MKYIKQITEEIEAFQWNGSTLEDAKEFAKEIGVQDYAIGSNSIKIGFIFYNHNFSLGGRAIISKGDYLIRKDYPSRDFYFLIMDKEEFENQYILKDC